MVSTADVQSRVIDALKGLGSGLGAFLTKIAGGEGTSGFGNSGGSSRGGMWDKGDDVEGAGSGNGKGGQGGGEGGGVLGRRTVVSGSRDGEESGGSPRGVSRFAVEQNRPIGSVSTSLDRYGGTGQEGARLLGVVSVDAGALPPVGGVSRDGGGGGLVGIASLGGQPSVTTERSRLIGAHTELSG